MSLPLSLQQINSMLTAAGMPALTPPLAKAAQGIAKREQIIDAIRRAPHDAHARSYLSRLFAQAGAQLSQAAQQQQQDAQQHMQHQSEQRMRAGERHPVAQPQSMQAPVTHQQPVPHPPVQAPVAHQQPMQQPAAPQQTDPAPAVDRCGYHVYGGKAALCFEADVTKGDDHTIALDAALATAPRQFNWGDKIRIQLTRAELPTVAAVLLGILPGCEFGNHGPENNKGFSIERQQGGKVYVKVFAKGLGVRGVPIMPQDLYYVASLFMRQLKKATPWLDDSGVLALLKATQAPR